MWGENGTIAEIRYGNGLVEAHRYGRLGREQLADKLAVPDFNKADHVRWEEAPGKQEEEEILEIQDPQGKPVACEITHRFRTPGLHVTRVESALDAAPDEGGRFLPAVLSSLGRTGWAILAVRGEDEAVDGLVEGSGTALVAAGQGADAVLAAVNAQDPEFATGLWEAAFDQGLVLLRLGDRVPLATVAGALRQASRRIVEDRGAEAEDIADPVSLSLLLGEDPLEDCVAALLETASLVVINREYHSDTAVIYARESIRPSSFPRQEPRGLPIW